MADWSTIASLATAGGTLVLAISTFSSVRASNRSARIAEQALLLNMRPVLAPANETDPSMTVAFGDRHLTTVRSGLAAIERAITRFSLVPTEGGAWLPGAVRHWRLDGVNPRG